MQVVRRAAGCQVKLHPFGAQNVERRHGGFRQVVIRRQQSAVNIKKAMRISLFSMLLFLFQLSAHHCSQRIAGGQPTGQNIIHRIHDGHFYLILFASLQAAGRALMPSTT